MSVQRILSWQINSINQERQEVHRSIDGGPAETIATLAADVTTYTDTQDVVYTDRINYTVSSVATIKGVEVRQTSREISTKVGVMTTPYTYTTASENFTVTSLSPFKLIFDGVEHTALVTETNFQLSVSTTAGTAIEVYPASMDVGYESEIVISGGASEVISWSDFDFGNSPVMIKPNYQPLTKVPETAPNTTSLLRLFSGAEILNDPNIGLWDTSKVTSFRSMLAGCKKFNQPVTNWDTSNATSLRGLFDRCNAFNQSVSHFNTSNCTDFGYMFNACMVFNQPLDNFDTSKATTMEAMFRVAYVFNQPINHFVTSSVTDMDTMFGSANTFNQPLNNWDTSSVTKMGNMFTNANAFNQDISGWDVSNVLDMTQMFYDASSFQQNLSQWCVAKIPSQPTQFAYLAGSFTHPVWGTCPNGS